MKPFSPKAESSDRELVLQRPPTQDQVLIDQILSWDTGAINILMDRYKNVVENLIGEFFENPSDWPDIEQEVWIEVFKYLGRIRGDFIGWLGDITNTRCIVQKERNERDPLRNSEEFSDDSVQHTNPPYSPSVRTQRRDLVDTGMRQLPEDQQKLLYLWAKWHSRHTIAQHMNTKKSNIGWRLFDTKRRMRELLEVS